MNIIFDTDLGNCTDDAFAMQALFACQNEGKCKVKGIMQSFKSASAKKLIDGFMHFYKADDVPLGLVDGDEPCLFKIVPYYELADVTKPDGTPLFPGTGIPLASRLPAWKLYRRILSEAEDNSITIVCTGMLTNLGFLIDSASDEFSPLSGIELITRKVRCLFMTGGCFSPMPLHSQVSGKPVKFLEIEYNIARDVALAKKVVECWPVTLYIFPIEEGKAFPSIHDKVIHQYEWQEDSPIFQIYSRYDEWAAGDVGQYLWDALSMLHAILGDVGFKCSEKGKISISDDGRTTFTVSPDGQASMISVDPPNKNALWNALDSISRFHP